MEQTIEFVPNPIFNAANAEKLVEAIRPCSLDAPPEFTPAQEGLAFVSGLVQTPLLTPEEERYWFTRMNFLKSRAEANRRLLDLNKPSWTSVRRIKRDLAEALRVRNHIVQGNVRLIVSLARKLSDSLELMSDLIGEGMIPMIRSVELFDIGLGNRFSTYATWAVRNQMLRILKRMRASQESSLGENAPSLENLPDTRSPGESDETVPRQRVAAIGRLLTLLSDRERVAVVARFGLDGHPRGQSFSEIAALMGLSKERVRQVVLTALEKLREQMSDDELESLR